MFCEGGCACGALRYALQTRPILVHACHCLNCQRLTGGAFAVNAVIEKNQLVLLAGKPTACELKGGSGQRQDVYFCATCGTHLWNEYHVFPGNTWFVRVGTFDDPTLLQPDVHIFTRSKQPWVVLPSGTPAFETRYDREQFWTAETKARLEASAAPGPDG